MNISLRQLVTSLIALLVSIATVFLFTQNARQLGNEPLVFRALVLSIAILAALIGLIWFPIKRLLKKRKEKKENNQKKID